MPIKSVELTFTITCVYNYLSYIKSTFPSETS